MCIFVFLTFMLMNQQLLTEAVKENNCHALQSLITANCKTTQYLHLALHTRTQIPTFNSKKQL